MDKQSLSGHLSREAVKLERAYFLPRSKARIPADSAVDKEREKTMTEELTKARADWNEKMLSIEEQQVVLLAGRVRKAKKEIAELKTKIPAFMTENEVIKQLQEENTALHEDKTSLEADASLLRTTNQSLETRSSALDTEIKSLQEMYDNLVEEMNQLGDENATLDGQNTILTDHNRRLTQKVESLRIEKGELRAKADRLGTEKEYGLQIGAALSAQVPTLREMLKKTERERDQRIKDSQRQAVIERCRLRRELEAEATIQGLRADAEKHLRKATEEDRDRMAIAKDRQRVRELKTLRKESEEKSRTAVQLIKDSLRRAAETMAVPVDRILDPVDFIEYLVQKVDEGIQRAREEAAQEATTAANEQEATRLASYKDSVTAAARDAGVEIDPTLELAPQIALLATRIKQKVERDQRDIRRREQREATNANNQENARLKAAIAKAAKSVGVEISSELELSYQIELLASNTKDKVERDQQETRRKEKEVFIKELEDHVREATALLDVTIPPAALSEQIKTLATESKKKHLTPEVEAAIQKVATGPYHAALKTIFEKLNVEWADLPTDPKKHGDEIFSRVSAFLYGVKQGSNKRTISTNDEISRLIGVTRSVTRKSRQQNQALDDDKKAILEEADAWADLLPKKQAHEDSDPEGE